jgi:hypothetical protein
MKIILKNNVGSSNSWSRSYELSRNLSNHSFSGPPFLSYVFFHLLQSCQSWSSFKFCSSSQILNVREYVRNDGKIKPAINFIEFSESFRIDNRRIEYTEFSEDCYVSTVFLGLNHGFFSNTPILYETMSFGIEEIMVRAATLGDAIRNHQDVVRIIQEKLNV